MKTQSGRSMIEMLGVLAIIGVLSIGGLAGYTRAMNAHQANQVMDYFNRCSVAVQENLAVASSLSHNQCNTTTGTGAATGYLDDDSNPTTGVVAITTGTGTFSISGTVDATVCSTIETKGTGSSNPTWTCSSNTTITAEYTL